MALRVDDLPMKTYGRMGSCLSNIYIKHYTLYMYSDYSDIHRLEPLAGGWVSRMERIRKHEFLRACDWIKANWIIARHMVCQVQKLIWIPRIIGIETKQAETMNRSSLHCINRPNIKPSTLHSYSSWSVQKIIRTYLPLFHCVFDEGVDSLCPMCHGSWSWPFFPRTVSWRAVALSPFPLQEKIEKHAHTPMDTHQFMFGVAI